MQTTSGLLHAHALPPDGRAKTLATSFADLAAVSQSDGPYWIHIERTAPSAIEWLEASSHVPPLVFRALTATESRPRAGEMPGGLFLNLRCINLNPGKGPEEMVSLRLWLTPAGLISARRFPVMALQAVRAEVEEESVAPTPAAVLVRVIAKIVDRIASEVDKLDDALNEGDAAQEAFGPSELSELRRTAITLHRYLAPQRDVLQRVVERYAHHLGSEALTLELRETADVMARAVEDLSAVREHAAVIGEENRALADERLNRNTYTMSLAASIFLPLGLVTGLFGVNVGGMPLLESENGFWLLTGGLAVCVAFQAWLLRRWGLL